MKMALSLSPQQRRAAHHQAVRSSRPKTPVTGLEHAQDLGQKKLVIVGNVLAIPPNLWYNDNMKNNTTKSKAFVFDLDGTLFETTAVVDEAAYGMDKFVEFLDTEKLKDESHPMPLMALARKVQEEGHWLFILTARNSVVAPAIRELLELHGASPTMVYCVGDKGLEVETYKAEILSNLSRHFDRLYFYDNEVENLNQARHTGAYIYDETGTRF
jgi:hypothetical protein